MRLLSAFLLLSAPWLGQAFTHIAHQIGSSGTCSSTSSSSAGSAMIRAGAARFGGARTAALKRVTVMVAREANTDAHPTRSSLTRKPRISEDMSKLMMEQAHMEMSASLTYISLSYWFDRRGMSGYKDYFRKQSDEEREHSLQFLDYLSKRGEIATINPSKLVQPSTEFETPLHAMECYLAHERAVADSINDKFSKAMQAGDWPTISFLQPFVAYQIEEEDTADTMMEEVYRLAQKDLTQVADLLQQQRGE
jgi:ferritin